MQTESLPSLEAQRHAQQLAFIASDADIAVGDADALPWPLDVLTNTQAGQAHVVQHFDAGLTAHVFRLRGAGCDWTLKCARAKALVQNIDGQTSFLNEVQRRADLAALKASEPQRWTAIVDTHYASYRQGIILSPWIEGAHVQQWDERALTQLLSTACALWTEGLFEWDLCPGNVLDDGAQVRLFDFGYMYRFNPLRHFNTAGNGCDEPLFHPAERFETRQFSGYLLDLAQGDESAALAAFCLEKKIALEAYRTMRSDIAARGANATVLAWIDSITTRWSVHLGNDIEALYWAEQWRSRVLDLDDDLRGKTCTPLTLRRADWLLDTLQHHDDVLRACGALFWGDEFKRGAVLLDEYRDKRALAERFQIG